MSATDLIRLSRQLAASLDTLRFAAPVAIVYDPLDYARAPHEAWLTRYGDGHKRVVYLGMNPGPFGMMQTGVPFGEVAAVRDWMGIEAPVQRPAQEHPKRRIDGFACTRSEVSGRRLWGWAAARFGDAADFFAENFVLNYCPLVFLEASGRNLTPDKLPRAEQQALQRACDAHLRAAIEVLAPQWVIGVGAYAAKRASEVLGVVPGEARAGLRVAQILHPSPASPIANRGWAQAADRQLAELGVYD